MLFDWLEPILLKDSLLSLVVLSGAFLFMSFGVVKGVSWIFSAHRTSRAETEDRLMKLRRSTRRRFLLAMIITIVLDFTARAGWSVTFGDERIGSAAFLGIVLASLSDLFMSSAMVLLFSVFTRPLGELLGALLDLFQSAVLATITGWCLKNLANFEFFRVEVSGVPISLVLWATSLIYSFSGTVLWLRDERLKAAKGRRA